MIPVEPGDPDPTADHGGDSPSQDSRDSVPWLPSVVLTRFSDDDIAIESDLGRDEIIGICHRVVVQLSWPGAA